MTNSFTGDINTEGTFETLASVSGLTISQGKSYSMQIQGTAYFKIDQAIFRLADENFSFTCANDIPYIKTDDVAKLTILENA